MQKLIELLNEYEKTLEPNLQVRWTVLWIEATPELIVGKKFWFIQWLVENDKIDFENMEWYWRLIWYLTDNMEKPTRDKVKEELVIMLLSISEKPIELLISLLK